MLTVTGSNGCTSTASAEVPLDNAALARRRRWHDHLHHELRDAAGHGQRQLQLDRPGHHSSADPNPTVCMAGTYTWW
ncbi:MAG: hypothetical protein IPJ87_05880 [Flavobacteriales bacterium]|nr:hypothetical protein [Flavobacteriales bacterium]